MNYAREPATKKYCVLCRCNTNHLYGWCMDCLDKAAKQPGNPVVNKIIKERAD